MTKEKNQGRTAAYHDLGIDPKNAQQLDAVKKWIESQKPDAQKIAEKQIEENSRLQEMQNRAFLAEVIRYRRGNYDGEDYRSGTGQHDCLADLPAFV